MREAARRLGRPPAASSAETRERILDVARREFAERGFEVTTNRSLAENAGITTGALYHYFDSKQAIYEAVYSDVQARIYERFEKAIVGIESFVDRVSAVLETAHDLNNEDPSLARFVGAARVDIARHADLKLRLVGPVGTGLTFFDRLIATGVERGEIAESKVQELRAFVRTVVAGLTDAVSSNPHDHRLAVNAIVASLRGSLLT